MNTRISQAVRFALVNLALHFLEHVSFSEQSIQNRFQYSLISPPSNVLLQLVNILSSSINCSNTKIGVVVLFNLGKRNKNPLSKIIINFKLASWPYLLYHITIPISSNAIGAQSSTF